MESYESIALKLAEDDYIWYLEKYIFYRYTFLYFHNDYSKEAAGIKSYESIALKLAEADYAW